MTDISSDHFRKVMGACPTPVTIVSAADEDGACGMVIGSFGSVSIDPPLVMFMPGKESRTWARIEQAGSFCVNIMGDDGQATCNSFFGEGDPFDSFEWQPTSTTGSPYITSSLGFIDCTIDNVVDGGDHWIVLGRVVEMDAAEDGSPLVYARGKYCTTAEL